MDRSMPGFSIHHQLPELAHTHVYQVEHRNYKKGVNCCDSGLGNCFISMTQKTQLIKEKIYKLDFMKIKHIYASKSEKAIHQIGKNICKSYIQ